MPLRLLPYLTRSLLVFLLACMLAACTPPADSVEPGTAPAIPLESCQLSGPVVSLHLEARCGSLEVPEDPADPAGRPVRLHIAVVEPVSRNPAPDPLFFIPGGPGEAASQAYLQVSRAFERLRQKRAVILVDQRGTGESGALRCPQSDITGSSVNENQSSLQESLQACLAGLEADPSLYTTEMAVEDLDRVRAALGYETINLYGGSYGTRVALEYLRRYPERTRAVILDGAAPPNWTLGLTVARDAQHALDTLFQRCAADPECNAAFPRLPEKFEALLDILRKGPVELELTDPVSGEPTQFTLTYDFFAGTIHSLTYAPETAALLPLLIHTAYTRNDFSLIAAQGIANTEQVAKSISTGMRFSVLCTEDAPYFEALPSGSNDQSDYLGDYFMKTFTEICETWPRGTIPADFKEPVRSEAPVLIISGEADPVTPPENGDLTAQTLANSLHIIVPGHGHINIFRGCLGALATEFIEAGSASNLDTDCVQTLRPMPFFLSFSGPQP